MASLFPRSWMQMPCPLLVLNALPRPDREEKCGCRCHIVAIDGWLWGTWGGSQKSPAGCPHGKGAAGQSQDS